MSSLQLLKETIEELPKFNQVEILRILKKDPDIRINENKNGIFVNLSLVNEERIKDIRNYVDYVNKQTKTLDEIENTACNISSTYF
jgi:hypothetical protein